MYLCDIDFKMLQIRLFVTILCEVFGAKLKIMNEFLLLVPEKNIRRLSPVALKLCVVSIFQVRRTII